MKHQSRRVKKQYNKIDPNSERIIIEYMQQWINNGRVERDPFAQISKMIPYDSKKICHHWTNKLDPKLCLINSVPLTSHEKEYIFEWVKNHINSTNNKISWSLLQSNMEEKFGLLRSRNDLKNVWYSKKRKINKHTKNAIHIDRIDDVSTLLESYYLQPLYLLGIDDATNDMMILETFNYSE
ncbi:hypothetical protein RclHR1_00040035 [Rhizophagus clarus]|uniref:HTH myb-type domain-containing protein n=1 Tax=Rhizophagus clarus TaxID=94130 RepID=A0A2Z6RFM2_9GLOM|nr:hypothetical protein RclHR1_00040035 [Rhizophagus clarus]GES91737.1 hypothetical protein GLOIN_2v1769545 [Rhizophagus clarus]